MSVLSSVSSCSLFHRVLLFCLHVMLQRIESAQPPINGSYACTLKQITVGGYVAGGTQDAYLMYPNVAIAEQKHFPFLSFAHGMTAGGHWTYDSYSKLWHSVCSRGYIIVGAMSCVDRYCHDWYKDVMSTITTCKAKGAHLDPALAFANFTKVGVYGHSMGGAATVHVSNFRNLSLVASVPLHPSCTADGYPDEGKDVVIPSLWFTGSKDTTVPPSGVKRYWSEDPTVPKIFAEIEGAEHDEPITRGPNREDAYVGLWFDCYTKDDQSACDYFFGSNPAQSLCNGGQPMTSCIVTTTTDDTRDQ